MPQYSAGARSTGAGSATLFVGSLFGTASRAGYLREVGLFNTAATQVALFLQRATAVGTPGAGLTEDPDDLDQAAAGLTAFNTHTGAPTLGNDCGYRAYLGAAIGAGAILTIGGRGKRIPAGTANGIGILPNGTGQILDFHFVWDE
jgi:hypothetical protein